MLLEAFPPRSFLRHRRPFNCAAREAFRMDRGTLWVVLDVTHNLQMKPSKLIQYDAEVYQMIFPELGQVISSQT